MSKKNENGQNSVATNAKEFSTFMVMYDGIKEVVNELKENDFVKKEYEDLGVRLVGTKEKTCINLSFVQDCSISVKLNKSDLFDYGDLMYEKVAEFFTSFIKQPKEN